MGCAVDSDKLRGELADVGELEDVRGEGVLVECGDGGGGSGGGVGAVYGVLLCGENSKERAVAGLVAASFFHEQWVRVSLPLSHVITRQLDKG